MSVLDEIVVRKRSDVAQRMAATPIDVLQAGVEPASHRFLQALQQPGRRFIFECKRASPSQGILREYYDPVALAADYAGVADAMSILTDAPYFGGSFEHLRAVRAVTTLPLLCKDFVVDPYQVVEARHHGADAVLLMLSVLDDAGWRACMQQVQALGMDALTEAHDAAEVERAVRMGASIIGINNRNLHTLQIDLATTRQLAPMIPRDRVIVCESGLRTRADMDAVAPQVDAYLVGSSLMRAERVDLAARTLAFGRVKVCGLTSSEDAQAAWQAGASLGGIIFVPGSPRQVSDAQARRIAQASRLPLVGVFANQDQAVIATLAHQLHLHAVQLHGDETPADIAALRALLPQSCEIWKALHPQDEIPLASEYNADRLLLDGPHGGSGQTFDWALLRDYPQRDRIVMAGGIGAHNAAAAQAFGVHAIDVNSSVESSPGRKDPERMTTLFNALRQA